MPEELTPYLPGPDSRTTVFTDPRFTWGLVLDVSVVLENRGYPPPKDGDDMVRLSSTLFRYLYPRAGAGD